MRKMKDSGLKWIGKIPYSWNVMPNKYLMKKKKVICPVYKGEDILSLTMKGVIVRDLNAGGKMPTSFDGYQRLESGNLLMCLFDIDVTPRCIGLIKQAGLSSPAYSQFELNDIGNAEYYCYYYIMLDDDKTLLHLAKNLRHSLTEEQLGAISVIVPPVQEQKRIANFLDAKCAEVDALATDIQAQIETLEQYKSSIITEAVTKGIDQDVQLKNSGIECIGEIPSDWNIKRVKHIACSLSKGNGITREDVKEDGNIQCIRYGEIYSKYENSFKECISYTNLESIESPKFASYGDILFAGTGELIEEIGKNVVYLGISPCLVGGDIIIMRHNQNPSFLNYALNSNYAQMQKSRGKAKLKVVHISASDIGNIRLALPSIQEQKAISNFLDTKCSEINEIIMKRKEQLEVLNEYKKSLIYEYVTGKKEVPEI